MVPRSTDWALAGAASPSLSPASIPAERHALSAALMGLQASGPPSVLLAWFPYVGESCCGDPGSQLRKVCCDKDGQKHGLCTVSLNDRER